MERCINCECMTSDVVCLLDGEVKDDIQLNLPKEKCEMLNHYKNDENIFPKQKVISFNAEVSVDDKRFSAHISRNKNKLVLEFEGNNVPLPIISKCKFNVKIQIPDDAINCYKDNCDKCLTPIC